MTLAYKQMNMFENNEGPVFVTPFFPNISLTLNLCSSLKSERQAELFGTCFMLSKFLDPEDGGDMFLRNIG
jgi:hypothetical protein